MSTELLEALARDAVAGEDPVGAAHVAARAEDRIRTRRRRWLAAYGGAAVLALGLVAANLGTPSPVRAPAAPAADSLAPPVPSVIRAEELLESAASRVRTSDRPATRQAGIACHRTAPEDALDACTALWVGEAPFLALHTGQTYATVVASAERVRIDVRWVMRNIGDRPVLVDHGDTLVALVTAPRQRAASADADGATYRGASLWADDRDRLARNATQSAVEEVEPGDTVVGRATFEAWAPADGAEPDPIWEIATGAVEGTLTVQLGVARLNANNLSALMVESSMAVPAIERAVMADDLMPSFVPRVRGQAAPADAQAALLCEVPAAMQTSHTQNYNVPYLARQVACEPGWVDGPVLVDDGASAILDTEPADTLSWAVTNVSGQTLQVARSYVLVEPDPTGAIEEPADLGFRGRAAGSDTSAWLPDGRRAAWLSNATYDFPIHPGRALGGNERLSGSLFTSDEATLVAMLRAGGTASTVVTLPFLADPSRVLLLEAPLAIG